VGVERAVTRWYALRQVLVEEIARLEAQLTSVPDQEDACPAGDGEVVSVEALHEQLARARERLRLLGPCPKPMMG
jgi:hypothetical protein